MTKPEDYDSAHGRDRRGDIWLGALGGVIAVHVGDWLWYLFTGMH